jgi:hypothetical protein
MSDVIDLIPAGTKHLNKSSYLDSINKKKDLLNKQLQLLHGDDYNADEVFSLNKKMNLNDD